MTGFLYEWGDQTLNTFMSLAPWLLLGLFLAGVLHVAFPNGLIARVLGKRGFRSVFWATLVGVPTPLCSCGVIPTSIGLKRDGASDGAAVGFLISTPQEGVNSIMVAAAFLGWPFAIYRVFAAMLTGLFGGVLTNLFGGEGVAPPPKREATPGLAPHRRVADLFRFAFGDLLRDIYIWIAIGVAVAGLLGAWLGDSRALAQYEVLQGIWGMLLVLVIAMPMYVCAVASVPVAAALVASGGLPAGAALVFLMAGPATNVATVGAIFKAFGKRIAAIYVLTVAVTSIMFGMLFEWVIPAGSGTMPAAGHAHSHSVALLATVALAVLMIGHALAPAADRIRKRRKENRTMSEQEISLTLKGMTCQNCVRHVEKALSNTEGVASAEVDLDTSSARVKGANLDASKLAAAVREAGYEAE